MNAREAAWTQRALEARVRGASCTAIGRALGLVPDYVAELIADADKTGDPRALSDLEAAAMLEALALPCPAQRSREFRFVIASRLRRSAAAWNMRNAGAASGMLHLADLWEHCLTRYPSLPIAAEEVTINRVHREPTHSGAGSSAALCLEG